MPPALRQPPRAGGVIGNPGKGRTAPAAAGVYVVPAGAASRAALRDPAVRELARYKDFTLVEAAPERRSRARRGRRRAPRRHAPRARSSAGSSTRRRGGAQAARAARRTGLPAGEGPLLVVVQFVGPLKDDWLARLKGDRRAGDQLHGRERRARPRRRAPRARRWRATSPTRPRSAGRSSSRARTSSRPASAPRRRVRVAVQTIAGDRRRARRARRPSGVGRSVAPGLARRPLLDAAHDDRRGAARAARRRSRRRRDRARRGAAAARRAPGAAARRRRPRARPRRRLPRRLRLAAVHAFGDAVDAAVHRRPRPTARSATARRRRRAPTCASTARPRARAASPTSTSSAPRPSDPAAYQGCDGHGTIDASILAGNNDGSGGGTTDAAGFRYGLGIEPRARLGGTTLFHCERAVRPRRQDASARSPRTPTSPPVPATPARASSNNSWGALAVRRRTTRPRRSSTRSCATRCPRRRARSRWSRSSRPATTAPGAGTLNTPGTAKNVITVGANESERAFRHRRLRDDATARRTTSRT